MKLVVVGIGGRDGGLVLDAGAADELDGDRRRNGKTGKFEGAFTTSSKHASKARFSRMKSLVQPPPPSNQNEFISNDPIFSGFWSCDYHVVGLVYRGMPLFLPTDDDGRASAWFGIICSRPSGWASAVSAAGRPLCPAQANCM